MASITPTNLYLQNMGSSTLTIAEFAAANDGDIWASGITDIISIIGGLADSPGSVSGGGAAFTFTASSGTIYIACESASKVAAWVASGFGNK